MRTPRRWVGDTTEAVLHVTQQGLIAWPILSGGLSRSVRLSLADVILRLDGSGVIGSTQLSGRLSTVCRRPWGLSYRAPLRSSRRYPVSSGSRLMPRNAPSRMDNAGNRAQQRQQDIQPERTALADLEEDAQRRS